MPHSFLGYLRSFGPGIVIVLTWLGAGDVVDMGVAGSNYGYSLMWVLVVALLLRFLPRLLSTILGEGGRWLFYTGIFAAIYTSVLGHAAGLGYMGSHAWLRWRAGTGAIESDYRRHPLYRWIVLWCLATPVIWTIPGMPDFVTLTLLANSAQVVLLPILAGGLWWITASTRYIGREYRNRWWENLVMALLFVLAVYGATGSVISILRFVRDS